MWTKLWQDEFSLKKNQVALKEATGLPPPAIGEKIEVVVASAKDGTQRTVEMPVSYQNYKEMKGKIQKRDREAKDAATGGARAGCYRGMGTKKAARPMERGAGRLGRDTLVFSIVCLKLSTAVCSYKS